MLCGIIIAYFNRHLFNLSPLQIYIYRAPLSSFLIAWLIGSLYMLHTSRLLFSLRSTYRRGALFFLRDPEDPNLSPMRDMLESNPFKFLYRVLQSFVAYVAIIVLFSFAAFAQLSLFGLYPIPLSTKPALVPLDIAALIIAISIFPWSTAEKWFHNCLKFTGILLAHQLRLSWFIFGLRRLDEEHWEDFKRFGNLYFVPKVSRSKRNLSILSSDGLGRPVGISMKNLCLYERCYLPNAYTYRVCYYFLPNMFSWRLFLLLWFL